MFLRCLFFTLLITSSLCAQQKGLRFIDAKTGIPVADADVYTDSTFIAPTNFNGNVKVDISGNYKTLIVSHVAYYRRIIPRDSLAVKKVYTLKKRADVLQEVFIDNGKPQDSTISGITQFSHGAKGATFIIPPLNSIITKIKFRVVDGYGVKGMRFLPFKANIYEMDSVTKLPGKQLLPNDVLVENKKGADWAIVDVSAYKLKLPEHGACLVFIVPPYSDGLYTTRTVWSEVGEIDAAPQLKSEATFKKYQSFYYYQLPFDNALRNFPGFKWRVVKNRRYMIEAEFIPDTSQN